MRLSGICYFFKRVARQRTDDHRGLQGRCSPYLSPVHLPGGPGGDTPQVPVHDRAVQCLSEQRGPGMGLAQVCQGGRAQAQGIQCASVMVQRQVLVAAFLEYVATRQPVDGGLPHVRKRLYCSDEPVPVRADRVSAAPV